jgi:antitoxin ParD1/3/4
MASINVSVPDHMSNWVQQRIEAGHYASAGDYVRDLIQRDHDQTSAQQTLIASLIEGEKSGLSKRLIPDILRSLKADLAETTE